ncbi:LLM class flavin-dependent oxidoreductase [Streptomyces sp. N2A]|uniref:LLM class flavin-dependent oxidoreductase n=1 Tax=Streptomyces sp. N2A TaxID=3073936 RepID=UPI00287034AE|nr:LLM class flavin-dependent oxidoreductase [Streptomyces sp. N2A]
MRFGVMTLIDNVPDALSGRLLSPHDRLREVVELAVLVEELGFDAFGVGERHGAPFLSSSPPAVLGAIAARTHRIRLFTTVTVLSTLDPVRVAEDYATVDQLSGGRLELAIGNNTPFRTLDEAADHGPALVGSPARIVDKILSQHLAYGHALQFFSVDSAGLPFARKAEVLRLAAAEVLPQLRHELPDPLPWPSPAPAGAAEAAR